MDEQTRAAFSSAQDTTKQLITLATGLLALEITFAKDLVRTIDSCGAWLVGISWIALLLSIVAGVWTLLALTGSLSSSATLSPRTIFEGNVRTPAILQVLLFVGALLFTVVFAIRELGNSTV
jgi:hypothetical protein